MVIKLILNCLIQFERFFPDFYVAFIMLRLLWQLIMSWEKAGGTGNARKAIAGLGKF